MATRPFFSGNYGGPIGSTAQAAQFIANAGVMHAKALTDLGRAGAAAIEKFQKNKEEKEEREAFVSMAGKMPVEVFGPFGATNEEEKTALIEGWAKSPETRKQAIFLAQLKEKADKDAGRKEYIRFMGGGEPEEFTSTGSAIGDEFARANAQSDAQPAVSIEDPNAFLNFAKRLKNPHAKELAVNHALGLFSQSPQRNLVGMQAEALGNEAALKAAQAQALTRARAAMDAPNFNNGKRYFIGDIEANRALNNIPGIDLLPADVRERLISRLPIVDPEALRKEASAQIDDLGLSDSVSVLRAAKDLRKFLEAGNPLSDQIAKEKLARMVQPTGILTEDDLGRVGGSPGLADRISSAVERVVSGTADEQTKKYLRDTTDVFVRRAAENLQAKGGDIAKYLSGAFGIDEEDAIKYTPLSLYGDQVPDSLGSFFTAPNASPPTPNASPGSTSNERFTTPGGNGVIIYDID